MKGRPKKESQILKKIATNLTAEGYKFDMVAYLLGVSPASLYRWKKADKDFCESIRQARRSSETDILYRLTERMFGSIQTEVTTDPKTNEVLNVDSKLIFNYKYTSLYLRNREK